MPEFWIDSDSLIESKKGPYAFDIAPGFWKFLTKNIRGDYCEFWYRV